MWSATCVFANVNFLAILSRRFKNMATWFFKLTYHAINKYLHKVASKLTYWGKCIQYNEEKPYLKWFNFYLL